MTLRTGWVVVRRTGAGVLTARSMVIVSAATTCREWIGPSAIFCPVIVMTPVLLARRWTAAG